MFDAAAANHQEAAPYAGKLAFRFEARESDAAVHQDLQFLA